MSGFALAFSACLVCRQTFGYNPLKVPNLRVEGVKEPICGPCIDMINREREVLNLDPLVIAPDAYDPYPEGDL